MAIIRADLSRPAIDIIGGSYEAFPGWSQLDNPDIRQRLERAIPAVGRLDITGHPTLTWLGTAFVVAPNLLITGSLSLVSKKDGEKVTLSPGIEATVDFGHELNSSTSLRVVVEEVVYVDPIWGIEFIRAQVPKSIAPLTLSTLKPDELADRELALIGYPARDNRNDDAVMEQVFRSVYDVKRLMPGKAIGAHVRSDKKIDLAHDCTSMGGTGAAPVIDLSTGHVVGVQYAGQYLVANYASPTADLANIPALSRASIHFLPKRRQASATPSKKPDPAPPEAQAIETPILLRLRPTLPAESWLADADEYWHSELEAHKERINSSLKSVGRLIISPSASEWAGTAFLVGEKLALTAAYLLTDFIDGDRDTVAFKPGKEATIDFSGHLSRVTGVKFVHPHFPVALLELGHAPYGVAPLDLYSQMPLELANRKVLLISFTNGTQLTLRPGRALQLGESPDPTRATALLHNCASGAGAGGAPLLDIGTGYVIGMHTHSFPEEFRNYATPTWELARDPHTWNHGISMRPDPRPPWLNRWEVPAGSARIVPVEPRLATNRWTVDKAIEGSIDWSRPEAQDMERLLLKVASPLRYAENVGFNSYDLNREQRPADLLRDLLNGLALARLLRRYVETVANDPNYAALSHRLRQYL